VRAAPSAVPDQPTVEVDVSGLTSSGDGLAVIRGGAIAIPFTIPGERVRVTPGGPFGTARLLEVVRASPHRVEPPCPHFGPDAASPAGPCGGCAWQHIAYPEQLRLKTAVVEDLVRRAVPTAPRTKPMLASTALDSPWGFRQKVHFVFGRTARGGGLPLVMGHYARGSRRVVPISACPVHDARGNALAFRLRDVFIEHGVSAAGPATRGSLRAVAVRVAQQTGEVMATLVVTDDRDRRLRAATRRALADDLAPTALHLNLHRRDDNFIFGAETRRLSGPARLRERVLETTYAVSPTAFFQTNVRAAELLVRLVLDAVPAGATVLDLYAGAGLFALPLAKAGRLVTAVEEHRGAVKDGEASVPLNGIPTGRCRFIARRVESALPTLRPADAVVLDPPREGASARVLKDVFARLAPMTAVYVSCNPETLARDLRIAIPFGYRVTLIQPVDMFPHTPHIETVAVLSR
jgi:23S rRNA (uracil1939-C5)-methyltransferase